MSQIIKSNVWENIGGGRFIEICDHRLVPDFFAPNYRVNRNLQSNPNNWTKIEFCKDTLEFQESANLMGSIETFNIRIGAQLAKDEPDKLDALYSLQRKRWVVIYHSRNGDRLVIGSKNAPVKITVPKRGHKRLPKQRNEYDIMLSVVGKKPAAFYFPTNTGSFVLMSGQSLVWMNGQNANYMQS